VTNNNGFQEAMSNLLQAQAQLTAAQATLANTQTLFLEQMAKLNVRMAAMEDDLGWIKTTLTRHETILQNLPEVIRQKIGFQGKQ
jgi:hypothetical protein